MKFHYAKRLDSFQAGIFAILNEKKDELVDYINSNLFVG